MEQNFFTLLAGDFSELRAWILKWLFLRRQAFKMSLAIGLADLKQRAYNRQYHVMLIELPQGDRLVSVSKNEIAALRRRKWLPRNMGMLELRRSIFYSTPAELNNRNSPEDRRRARERYAAWCGRGQRKKGLKGLGGLERLGGLKRHEGA
jgi:hypothetical protein